MTAAILEVTALATAGVEKWPQAVRLTRRGRRAHPLFAEKRVTYLEAQLVAQGHVRGGVREGVAIGGLTRGRRAAGQFFAGLIDAGAGGERHPHAAKDGRQKHV